LTQKDYTRLHINPLRFYLVDDFCQFLILDGPHAQTLGQSLVADIVLSAELDGRSTGGNGAQVVLMSVDVETDGGTSVASNVGDTLADADLVGGEFRVGRIASRQPVLGGDVTVSKDHGGQARNGVVDVGDAELGASLVGDELRESSVANTRSAIGVDVEVAESLAEVSGSEGSDSTTEGVSSGDDAVVGVGGAGSSESRGSRLSNLSPGSGEASVDGAAADDVAAGGAEEDNVGDEVSDVVAAAEGQDDLLAGVVNGDEATDTGEKTTTPVSLDLEEESAGLT
jgi:hypothetical protein